MAYRVTLFHIAFACQLPGGCIVLVQATQTLSEVCIVCVMSVAIASEFPTSAHPGAEGSYSPSYLLYCLCPASRLPRRAVAAADSRSWDSPETKRRLCSPARL